MNEKRTQKIMENNYNAFKKKKNTKVIFQEIFTGLTFVISSTRDSFLMGMKPQSNFFKWNVILNSKDSKRRQDNVKRILYHFAFIISFTNIIPCKWKTIVEKNVEKENREDIDIFFDIHWKQIFSLTIISYKL